MEPTTKKQKTKAVATKPWSLRRKKPVVTLPTASSQLSNNALFPPSPVFLATSNLPTLSTFPAMPSVVLSCATLESHISTNPLATSLLKFTIPNSTAPITTTILYSSQTPASSTSTNIPNSKIPANSLESKTKQVTNPPKPKPAAIDSDALQVPISYTPISRPLTPIPTPSSTTPDAPQEMTEVDCSVDDLVSGDSLEYDAKDSPLPPTQAAYISKNNEDLPTRPTCASDSKLIRHLESVMHQRKNDNRANKLQATTIAEGLHVSEYKDFLMSAFSSSMAVLSSKELKKKESELRKRKPSPVDYVEEIRSMMHSFGDVANALKESAQFLELLVCKYITRVLALLIEVMPKHKIPEVSVEAIAVALLPDMKRVYKIQQWVSFISQGRSFTHATETGMGTTPGTGGTTDDNYTRVGVQTLEIISTEAKAKPKASNDEALNALFSDPVWQERLEKAKEEVQTEKLARAAARDRLSSSIPLAEYEFYEECAKANFTKPNKRTKFEQFMQARCMGTQQGVLSSLSFSSMALDVLGLLAREFLEEVVVGALEKRVGNQKKNLEPIDILMYLKGVGPTPTSK